MTQKEQLKQEARQHLKQLIKPKTILLIFIKKIAPSGMSRQMTVGIVINDTTTKQQRYHNLTYYINNLLGYSDEKEYIRVNGCGMDMTFWLADTITYHLYGDKKPKWLSGNGGSCLNWQAVY